MIPIDTNTLKSRVPFFIRGKNTNRSEVKDKVLQRFGTANLTW
jgi:hypothetical protein